MTPSVHRLTPRRRADFWEVHADGCGSGWCWCAAWWVDTWDGWGERTSEDNRAAREALFEGGEDDGYLLYVDDRPVGWCQVGPRDRLKKLVRQLALPPDPEVWAITCFLVAPELRRQGLASVLLAGVLDDLAARGVARVQAYPRRGAAEDPGHLWTGPASLLARHGFVEIAPGVVERAIG